MTSPPATTGPVRPARPTLTTAPAGHRTAHAALIARRYPGKAL